jgi:hypothetical protein
MPQTLETLSRQETAVTQTSLASMRPQHPEDSFQPGLSFLLVDYKTKPNVKLTESMAVW